ncbi:DUF7662 domain-containing protein [Kaistia sp. MMO-174]|uniref:DUF7662 domain-containing protein n=1 Tax=Kaistia sp. MMO-174 TaxID=3081256 RepID=UPI0030167032
MSKYDALRDFLAEQVQGCIKLSLDEINLIVSLPNSARRYASWWANEDPEATGHVQCKAWLAAGYEAKPNLQAGAVQFSKFRLRVPLTRP